MALADALRERVSRRGRTAQVDCGALGTVTVEALSPRECAALGMADGGRALIYAACRELQAAGEVLRRERRLFTPDEVTQYVSDGEARTAARTVLALSGVTLDEGEADNEGETADKDDKADNETVEPESPDKSEEAERPDIMGEKAAENRLETVHESVQQISEIRPKIVQEQAASHTGLPAESANRLETVHKNVQQLPKALYEIRPGNVQFQGEVPADGQVSREFFGDAEIVREIPSIGPDLNFEPQNLALSEKNGGFMSPLNLSGETEGFPAEQSAAHEIKSEIRESVHEIKSEFGENRREGLHETTSELAEQVAERLLEGLRRAAMVR